MVDSDGKPLVEGAWYWVKEREVFGWECGLCYGEKFELSGVDGLPTKVQTIGPRIMPPNL